MHLSAGKTGGPHRGDTLLERAVDVMLQKPGLVLVQSVGNYADAALHVHARVGPDQEYVLDWMTPRNDRTPNELEIWYSGEDVFEITLTAPGGQRFTGPLQTRTQLRDGLEVWGNLYHRQHEPNSGMNHVDAYLYTTAPSGRWRVTLRGKEIVDGRLHAWIERDASGRYQSRFPRAQASSRFTTNTICNCYRAIAVGAYDHGRADRPPTRFSSRGPTADGRQKPELAAPGYRIRAARSLPRDGWRGQPKLVAKSGTSMAAPLVSGTVALMLAAAGRPLTIYEIRRALIGSVDPHAGPTGRTSTQLGYGYLNTAAAVAAARRIGAERPVAPPAPVPRGSQFEDLPVETFQWAVPAEDVEHEPASPEGEAAVHESSARPCGSRRAASEPEWDSESGRAETADEQEGPDEWEDIQDALEAVGDIDQWERRHAQCQEHERRQAEPCFSPTCGQSGPFANGARRRIRCQPALDRAHSSRRGVPAGASAQSKRRSRDRDGRRTGAVESPPKARTRRSSKTASIRLGLFDEVVYRGADPTPLSAKQRRRRVGSRWRCPSRRLPEVFRDGQPWSYRASRRRAGWRACRSSARTSRSRPCTSRAFAFAATCWCSDRVRPAPRPPQLPDPIETIETWIESKPIPRALRIVATSEAAEAFADAEVIEIMRRWGRRDVSDIAAGLEFLERFESQDAEATARRRRPRQLRRRGR